MKHGRSLCLKLCLLAASLAVSAAARAQAAYTSIVVFGDSLSDTGNDAAVSFAKYGGTFGNLATVPAPATGYTQGRFTDGTDTTPAAKLYTGVWVEQLAAQLTAKPPVINSLTAGGTNYAYGFATTNSGTSSFTYGPGNALSFTVSNMGMQVQTYLATNPTITNQTLFVVWGGANDLIAATTQADIVNAATREIGIIQTLITAGASNFIIPGLPPLGLVPRFNGSTTTSLPATTAALGYNQALAAGLAQLAQANAGKSINFYSLDTATLFNTIVASPAAYGFANITASSQANPAINPDTYLFWDDLHPTTAGHHLIASNALRLLGTPVVTSTTLATSAASPNLNASVTFKATVTNSTNAADTPIGNVTFYDGTTSLGTALLTGSGAAATASFSTAALTAGPHSITAQYVGVNGFASSASATTTETVIPPSYSAALGNSNFTVPVGVGGNTTLTITPAGGFTGSFTIACGTLPAHFSCTVGSPTLTVITAAAVSTTVAFTTNNGTSSLRAQRNSTVLAWIGLPLLAGIAGARKRLRTRLGSSLFAACFVLLSLASLAGLTGCGGTSPTANNSSTGTFTIPVTVTPAAGTSGTATNLKISVTIQ